jgi:C1A family cysteine protease
MINNFIIYFKMWEWIFVFILIALIIWLSLCQKPNHLIPLNIKSASTMPEIDLGLPMTFPQASEQLFNLGIPKSVIEQNKSIIEDNIQTINKLNSESAAIKKLDPNSDPPRYGITTAAAYPQSEFLKYNLGLSLNPNYANQFTVSTSPIDPSKIKQQVNWTTDTPLPIYNQSNCGCCWAVSASTILNYHLYKKYASNLAKIITNPNTYISCLSTDPNNKFSSKGCSGGDPQDVFKYTEQESFVMGLLNSNQNLTCAFPVSGSPQPMPGGQPMPCNPSKNCDFINKSDSSNPNNQKLQLKVSTVVLIPAENSTRVLSKDEVLRVKQYLSTVGPLVICIDATQQGFQHYKSGVMGLNKSNPEIAIGTGPDHAVVLSGYGQDSNGEFWIIQNSWDVSWGINGYCKSYVDATGITYVLGITT